MTVIFPDGAGTRTRLRLDLNLNSRHLSVALWVGVIDAAGPVFDQRPSLPLRARHPAVAFESCAPGGGRIGADLAWIELWLPRQRPETIRLISLQDATA